MTCTPTIPPWAALDRLVGTWEITGEATGRVTFRWLAGGGFLHQEGHLDFDGHRNEFVELIGRAHPPNAARPADITSRVNTGAGQVLVYTHELAGDDVTIWFGDRGSDNRYRGTFSIRAPSSTAPGHGRPAATRPRPHASTTEPSRPATWTHVQGAIF